jgi:hypothetical protein
LAAGGGLYFGKNIFFACLPGMVWAASSLNDIFIPDNGSGKKTQ